MDLRRKRVTDATTGTEVVSYYRLGCSPGAIAVNRGGAAAGGTGWR